MPNQMSRIEAKLDALLNKAGIKPESVIKEPPPYVAPTLTPQQQEAINNAPKPSGISGPMTAPAVAVPVPPDAVGDVTVETVDTMPADAAKGKGKPGEKVNWNS